MKRENSGIFISLIIAAGLLFPGCKSDQTNTVTPQPDAGANLNTISSAPVESVPPIRLTQPAPTPSSSGMAEDVKEPSLCITKAISVPIHMLSMVETELSEKDDFSPADDVSTMSAFSGAVAVAFRNGTMLSAIQLNQQNRQVMIRHKPFDPYVILTFMASFQLDDNGNLPDHVSLYPQCLKEPYGGQWNTVFRSLVSYDQDLFHALFYNVERDGIFLRNIKHKDDAGYMSLSHVPKDVPYSGAIYRITYVEDKGTVSGALNAPINGLMNPKSMLKPLGIKILNNINLKTVHISGVEWAPQTSPSPRPSQSSESGE